MSGIDNSNRELVILEDKYPSLVVEFVGKGKKETFALKSSLEVERLSMLLEAIWMHVKKSNITMMLF